MPVPTATADASLYRTSGAYRSPHGQVHSSPGVTLADSCYSDCMKGCDPQDPVEKLECKAHCNQQCTRPPPCLGELCLFGPQRRCCPHGTTCCYGYEYPSARQIIGCCSPGWECCGEGKCCEPGHSCCAPRGFGPSRCCPPGQKCCDGVCYTPGQGTVCTGDGTVCPQDNACGERCCLPGEKCIGGKCCKPGPLCGGGQCCEGELCTSTGCCPQSQYNTATMSCCPQGGEACKVKVWPPPGLEGDPEPYIVEQCCPPGQICLEEACCTLGDCCRNNADCSPGTHCDKNKCCPQGKKAKFNDSSGKMDCV